MLATSDGRLGAWESVDPEVQAQLQRKFHHEVAQALLHLGLSPREASVLSFTARQYGTERLLALSIEITCAVDRDPLAPDTPTASNVTIWPRT